MACRRYITKLARGETRDLPRIFEVLNECPEGYRLHSVVPYASGGGYTSHFTIIFELEALSLTSTNETGAA